MIIDVNQGPLPGKLALEEWRHVWCKQARKILYLTDCVTCQTQPFIPLFPFPVTLVLTAPFYFFFWLFQLGADYLHVPLLHKKVTSCNWLCLPTTSCLSLSFLLYPQQHLYPAPSKTPCLLTHAWLYLVRLCFQFNMTYKHTTFDLTNTQHLTLLLWGRNYVWICSSVFWLICTVCLMAVFQTGSDPGVKCPLWYSGVF